MFWLEIELLDVKGEVLGDWLWVGIYRRFAMAEKQKGEPCGSPFLWIPACAGMTMRSYRSRSDGLDLTVQM
jgi:hypothetical protein